MTAPMINHPSSSPLASSGEDDLTLEQKARIEKNRLAALARKRQPHEGSASDSRRADGSVGKGDGNESAEVVESEQIDLDPPSLEEKMSYPMDTENGPANSKSAQGSVGNDKRPRLAFFQDNNIHYEGGQSEYSIFKARHFKFIFENINQSRFENNCELLGLYQVSSNEKRIDDLVDHYKKNRQIQSGFT